MTNYNNKTGRIVATLVLALVSMAGRGAIVSIDDELTHGHITQSTSGTTVTLTAVPDASYFLNFDELSVEAYTEGGGAEVRRRVTIPMYTITVTNNGDGTYTFNMPDEGYNVFVTAVFRQATLTLPAGPYVYNGSEQTPAPTVKIGDTTLAASTDYNVDYAGNKNVGTANVTVKGKGKYFGTVTSTFAIGQKEVGLTWANTSLTYNGSLQAPTATATGLCGSDVCTVTVTGEQANVGNYVATASALSNPNYKLPAANTQAFSIGKMALTVTAKPKTIIYGQAPANDGVTYSAFAGTETAAVLGGTLDYEYNYSQFGDVGSYTITPKGLTSSNYDISFTAGTLTVEKKEVGLNWTNVSLTYSGSPQAPTATATGTVNGDVIGVTVSGAQTNVGNGYVATATALTGAKAGNYKLPAANTCTFSISEAGMEGISVAGYTGAYDGEEHGITVTAPAGATVMYGTSAGSYTLDASPKYKDVSTNTIYYQITKSGFTPVTGSATVKIDEKEVGLEWGTSTFTYNGSAQAPTATATGLCGSDACTVTVTGEQTNVGNYVAMASALSNSNYKLPAANTQAFSIGKMALTVTAKPKTITYGEAPANDGVTYSAFAGTETAAVLGGTLDYDYNYLQYGDVGNYTITPKGLTSNNYDITFTAGTLTVEQKEVGLSWTNTSLTYNGSPQMPTATATGTVNGDAIGVTVTGAQTNVGNGYVATATALTGAKAGNYKLPAANTCTFSISEAGMAGITATGWDNIYDGEAHGITVNNIPDGAMVKYGETEGSYTLDASPKYKNVNTYTVYYQVTKIGFTPVTGSATVNIAQKPLTITADAKSKIFGETDPALTYTSEGLITGEAITGELTRETGEDVGTYPINQGTVTASANYAITYVGANLTINKAAITAVVLDQTTLHYTGTPQTVNVTSVKAGTLDVPATAYTVTGNTETAVGDYTVTVTAKEESNFDGSKTAPWSIIPEGANTFDVSGIEASYVYTGAPIEPEPIVKEGTTTLTKNTDYTVAYAENKNVGTATVTITGIGGYNGTKQVHFDITQKPLTITANPKTITYGDAPANDGVTYSGFAGTEDASVLTGTLAYDYNYTQYEDVGDYAITPKGLTSTNYDITFTAGTLTVEQKEVGLTWSPNPASFTYTGSAQAPTATATGLVNGDVIDVTVTIAGEHTAVGNYTATASALTGAKVGNYKLPAANTCDFTITPLTGVVVTITGHNNKVAFDGAEHSVTGYDVKISNPLYQESDFTFSGTAKATRTDVGKTYMGLDADQFTNNNANFANVTFNVTDGYQEITSIDEVIVTITGHINTADYDGTEHSVSGYDVSFSNALYTESDFTFSGIAKAARTDAGKTMMGLDVSQFTNTNMNFGTVIFVVTDGYQEISPIAATVTITGHNNTLTYDGAEHSVSGYDVSFSNALYTESDFTFSGTAEAKRTDEGTTYMGLAENQFTNISPNFDPVTFKVTDGYMCITSVTDVVVTITGYNNTTDYDGTEHKVTGYDVKISNPLYKESDFTFSGTAEAARKDAGTTFMGLDASQFTNTNTDFTNVTFKVTDGYQTISPITAAVTITGHRDIVVYDGTEHKVTGYDVIFSNNLYQEADFTFSGTAEAKRTDQGTTNMGLAVDQFANTNTNFSTVTFSVIDGYQTITKKTAALTVTVTPKTYDGNTDAEVNVTVDTRVKGESLTITGLTGTFDNANAGTDKTVTVNSSLAVVTVGENTKLENYVVVYPTQVNGTITKRSVVVSGITAEDKDYDGTTDATLVFDNAQFDGILAGDNLTVTATGKFENAEAGENKTVIISDLTLGGESVANYMLAAEGQQTATTATIRQTIFDRRHSGIEVRRNDTNELVDNDAFLTVMDDGTLRIDHVNIINPDPVNGIADGVTMYIPATLRDHDGTTGAIYGMGSDIIVTDDNVPVTDIWMPETDEIVDVALQAFRLDPAESTTARIHTTLPLLDDYALTAGLKAEYEAGKVMTTIKTATQFWTLSCGVDIVVPDNVTAYTCQADGITAVAAVAITNTTAIVNGTERIIVKANNGVMMSGTPGNYDLVAWPSAERPSGTTPSLEDAKTYDGNQLEPALVRTHFTPTEYYILYYNTFHELRPDDDTYVSPCKAVLRKNSTAQAKSLKIGIYEADEATGIEEVREVNEVKEGDWYTLDGKKLDIKPTMKGIYINGNRKVVIK